LFEVNVFEKPAFNILGKKAWREFKSPDDVAKLFEEAHERGLIEKLKTIGSSEVTNSAFLGIAMVSEGGGMDYYFAAEAAPDKKDAELVSVKIEASLWAVIKGKNSTLEEIGALEQYGYGEWLEGSGYIIAANKPQMNVFVSEGGEGHAELWLPVEEATAENTMKLRPYLTFNGQCEEALELYKKAFQAEVLQLMRFSDMPPMPGFEIPEEFKSRILQVSLKFGADFIRMSDCGPGHPLNDVESERISIAVETTVEKTKHAFEVLSKEGRVGMPLGETFYSPLAGVVFDKFGVMWNFVARA